MKHKPCLLRINREGEFKGMRPSLQQCGKVGQVDYRYFVTIEATNKHLTPEGYVMENRWVESYFQNRYGPRRNCPSCEEMAQNAVDYFRKLFGAHHALKDI